MSDRCICGHGESMHYAPSGRCMRIVTRDPRLESHMGCTCREFRAERPDISATAPPPPGEVIIGGNSTRRTVKRKTGVLRR